MQSSGESKTWERCKVLTPLPHQSPCTGGLGDRTGLSLAPWHALCTWRPLVWGTGREQQGAKEKQMVQGALGLLCHKSDHTEELSVRAVLAAAMAQLMSGHPWLLLGTVPAACVAVLERPQGCAGWLGFPSVSDKHSSKSRQAELVPRCCQTCHGCGTALRRGQAQQGAPATMSNVNQVFAGTGCNCTLQHHHFWEQLLGHCRVLVSVFTWASAASPTLNQLLALPNPSSGQVSRKTHFQHLSLWAPRGV